METGEREKGREEGYTVRNERGRDEEREREKEVGRKCGERRWREWRLTGKTYRRRDIVRFVLTRLFCGIGGVEGGAVGCRGTFGRFDISALARSLCTVMFIGNPPAGSW